MLQIAIVVFREILEISLIIGILTAATKEIAGRSKWIFNGLTLGIITSLILAFFTDKLSESLDGMGQEFFNGLILISAATMIGWTVLWMQKHAKSISGDLKRLSNSVREGKKPLYALLVVVFLSVLRESAEIVLFTYSYYVSGTQVSEIILGLILGLILGSAIGFALYFGILKAFGRYFFIVTTWLLIFLSAGILAQGIGFWINAQIIPTLGEFDVSMVLSQQSFFGKFLHIFFGYIDQPAGSQIIAYFATLAVLIIGLKIVKRT
ncbi:MAG: FTR1 family protein [Proteobacteria bacterium]|nr:FTR1 family protein [Pseudomonadota bacterium]